jgi:hypothetical protein
VVKRRQCRAGSTCRRIQQPDRMLRSRHTTCNRVKLNHYTKGKKSSSMCGKELAVQGRAQV